MKKHLTIIALFCLLGTAHALTTKVYGNLGLGNVNISVINTQYGTSSDTQGYYELLFYDRTKSINFYYSCLGYQDTIVQLTPKQLQNDSINISFKMRKQDYSLQEVEITATKDFYRTKGNRYIADTVFFDSTIVLLETPPNTSTLCVLDAYGVKQACE